MGLAETNINWANKWARAKWCRLIEKAWPGSRVFVLSISTDDSESVNLQGGVSLIVSRKWAAHVQENGSDPLGRWVWVTLYGSNGRKLTVVSAYRPNEGGPSSGSDTVWRQ